MKRFAVVTDSTSNLMPDLSQSHDIDVIPLNVHWGEETYLDGVTLKAGQFYRWLREREDFPKTSQPSAGAFIEFFETVAEKHQVTAILGVFISAEMSGTVASALQAKAALAERRPDLEIEVIDSRSVSMGLGLQAIVAARAMQNGRSIQEAAATVRQVQETLNVVFVVDTLTYLHRGGRIGGAARLLGSALNLKPVLTIVDGRIESLEKVRSRRKSLRRLVQILQDHWADRSPTEMAIMQAEAEPDLDGFVSVLRDQLGLGPDYIRVLTPVVGTHSGPGTIGVATYALDAVI
jgi:DegV family protein with EDD domain